MSLIGSILIKLGIQTTDLDKGMQNASNKVQGHTNKMSGGFGSTLKHIGKMDKALGKLSGSALMKGLGGEIAGTAMLIREGTQVFAGLGVGLGVVGAAATGAVLGFMALYEWGEKSKEKMKQLNLESLEFAKGMKAISHATTARGRYAAIEAELDAAKKARASVNDDNTWWMNTADYNAEMMKRQKTAQTNVNRWEQELAKARDPQQGLLGDKLSGLGMATGMLEKKFAGISDDPRVKAELNRDLKDQIEKLIPGFRDDAKYKGVRDLLWETPETGKGGRWGTGESWWKDTQSSLLQNSPEERQVKALLDLLQEARTTNRELEKLQPFASTKG